MATKQKQPVMPKHKGNAFGGAVEQQEQKTDTSKKTGKEG